MNKMYRNRLIPLVLAFVFLWSCKTARIAENSVSLKDLAQAASAEGNFGGALQNWESYFSQLNAKNLAIPQGDYVMAANDAFKAQNFPKAVSWFDSARLDGYEGADMHLACAAIFRSQDNLSRELTSLRVLADKYPEVAAKEGIHTRLFEIYMEIDREKALAQWNKLDETVQGTEKYLENYFLLNKNLNNNALCDSLAEVLLVLNPGHVAALEWNGEKYYWLSENRYQTEMEKYNKKRTHVQYQFLLGELKKVTADFIRSRDYFEKLWKKDENPRYATFLANIYNRLDNPEKAQYYKIFSE